MGRPKFADPEPRADDYADIYDYNRAKADWHRKRDAKSMKIALVFTLLAVATQIVSLILRMVAHS